MSDAEYTHYMKGGMPGFYPPIKGKGLRVTNMKGEESGQITFDLYDPFNFGFRAKSAESRARGRPPKNWWDIPRENSRSKERRYGAHPSMKPLQICERIVKVHSDAGGCVLVPFGGSGSEVVASSAYLRISPPYLATPVLRGVLCRRRQDMTQPGALTGHSATRLARVFLSGG